MIFLEWKQMNLPNRLKTRSLDYLDQYIVDTSLNVFINWNRLLPSPFWQYLSSKCLMHIYDELVGFQSFLFTNFVYIFRTCSSLGKEKTGFFLHLCSLNDKSPHSTLKTIVSTYWLKENCPRGKLPPIPKLILTQTLTLTRGHFSWGQLFGCPPTLKLTITLTQSPTLNREKFSSGVNFPDTFPDTFMLIYFMSQPNMSYFRNNSSMNTISQKQHKKRKNPARKTGRCSFVYE